MARGWESKSVEDQMGAAEAALAERDARAKPHLSPQQRETNERRQSLLLSRSQILSRLKVATNARYRAQLELALKHVDAQLQEREASSTER
jgi:hypothetical protein